MPKITDLLTVSDVQNVDYLVLVRNDGGVMATKNIQFINLVNALMYDEFIVKVVDHQTDLEGGDGKLYFPIPETLHGCQIVDVNTAIWTPSTTTVTVQLHNVTKALDVCSTRPAITAGLYNSYEHTTVVSNGAVSKGDRMRVDVDGAGSGTKGLDVIVKVKKL